MPVYVPLCLCRCVGCRASACSQRFPSDSIHQHHFLTTTLSYMTAVAQAPRWPSLRRSQSIAPRWPSRGRCSKHEAESVQTPGPLKSSAPFMLFMLFMLFAVYEICSLDTEGSLRHRTQNMQAETVYAVYAISSPDTEGPLRHPTGRTLGLGRLCCLCKKVARPTAPAPWAASRPRFPPHPLSARH